MREGISDGGDDSKDRVKSHSSLQLLALLAPRQSVDSEGGPMTNIIGDDRSEHIHVDLTEAKTTNNDPGEFIEEAHSDGPNDEMRKNGTQP